MAERYGILPSVLLERSSTIDLFVFDTAASYRAAKEREASGKKSPADISQDELLKRMEKFKNAKGDNKNK